MDDELKNYLAGMEARLDGKFDKLEARLDGKLEKLGACLDGRIDKVEAGLVSLEERLEAKIEKVETSLLTEFHKWASPVESRLRTHRAWVYEVDSEVELIKERIRKLEGERNA